MKTQRKHRCSAVASGVVWTPLSLVLAVLSPSVAHAEWSVEKASLGPGYVVRHDSRSSELVVSTRFRTKRGAMQAADALNRAEDNSEGGDHETGSNPK